MLNLEAIEVIDSVDDFEENEWKTRTMRTHETEWRFRQNGAKNAFPKVAFWGTKSGFLVAKSGFFTLSNGFLFFRLIAQKR